ncbi:MAG: sugar phosphate isomerase/epimerase [Clostridia bacterium]|nr:sugar phosphate isomerase/epimerase [Clostridia bacterium]
MRVGVFYAYFPDGDPVNWPEVLRRAKEDGADHVELSSMRLLRQSREMRLATVETAKELGLTYSFCTSLPVNGDVASENIADQRRGIEAIKQNLELVAEMDGKVIGGMIHGSTNKPGVQVSNDTRQRRLENSARAVQEMGRTAESLGIRIGLEMCNRYENTMLNTVDQGLVFLQMVDSPAVGLHLDTYHMNIEEDNLPDAIVKAGKSIVNVHACENNRKLPGMGHLDWPSILCALKEAGYTGSLATECFSIPYGCWINDHRLWRPYVRDGIDEDLKKSMRYLKALM